MGRRRRDPGAEELDRALWAAAVAAYKLGDFDQSWRIAMFQIPQTAATRRLTTMAMSKMLGRQVDDAELFGDDEDL